MPQRSGNIAESPFIIEYNTLATTAYQHGYRTPSGKAPPLFGLEECVAVEVVHARCLHLEEWLEAKAQGAPNAFPAPKEEEVAEAPKVPRKALRRFWAIVQDRGLDASKEARGLRMEAVNQWMISKGQEPVVSVSRLPDALIDSLATAVEHGLVQW